MVGTNRDNLDTTESPRVQRSFETRYSKRDSKIPTSPGDGNQTVHVRYDSFLDSLLSGENRIVDPKGAPRLGPSSAGLASRTGAGTDRLTHTTPVDELVLTLIFFVIFLGMFGWFWFITAETIANLGLEPHSNSEVITIPGTLGEQQ